MELQLKLQFKLILIMAIALVSLRDEIIYPSLTLFAMLMLHADVPDAIAASWMGHTVDVHNKQYQRWLSDRDHQKVFESVKNF